MSEDVAQPQAEDSEPSARVAFDYIKGQHFRVIHADGVLGSLTPGGNLHMALFSERPAIPRRQVYELSNTGELGGMIPAETVSRNSIVREIDVDVIMTVATAEKISQWLRTMLDTSAAGSIAPKVGTGGSQ